MEKKGDYLKKAKSARKIPDEQEKWGPWNGGGGEN